RADPHPQGPPQHHRREIRRPDRRALWRQGQRLYRDRSHLQGWPEGLHQGHADHPQCDGRDGRTEDGGGMTSFEKANLKQIAFVALLLAAATALLPFSAQLYVVPICFAWGGAIVLWMVLSDRN